MRPFRERMRRRAEHRSQMVAAAERRKRQAAAVAGSSDELYFVDAEWSQKPALQVVADHLAVLADIVQEAHRQFGEPPNKPLEPTR